MLKTRCLIRQLQSRTYAYLTKPRQKVPNTFISCLGQSKKLTNNFSKTCVTYNYFNLFVRNNHSKMPPISDVNLFVDQLIKENDVMLFSKSYCPFCKKVKAIFDGINVPYKAYELDLEDGGEAIQNSLLSKTGQKTVPNIFIKGKHLGGASDTESAFNDGRLQTMLSGDDNKYDYDLFILGGGSGGLSCSKEAVQFGARVGVADFVVPTPIGTQWGIGGTCVNVGCIPKKLMHQAALLGESIHDSKHYGWEVPDKPKHDWGTMVQAIQDHVRGLNWGYKVQLRQKKVKYYNKLASFVDKNTLNLTDKAGNVETITARNIVLAMGGRPSYPNIPGAKECCITSDDIFSMQNAPGKTLFVGASYISLECAGFLHGLGYDTTVIVRSIFLRGFDQDMANKVAGYMEETGVKFIKQCVPTNMEKQSDGKVKVTFKNSEGVESSDIFDTVCLAVGRSPCTKGIGLENTGVEVNSKNGFVITDDNDQTNIPNIYGIGDLADGKPELTPVAIQAGKLLARRLFAGAKAKCDYTNIPTTVFTPLEYGVVGFSEEDAISKFGEDNIEVYHSNFTPLEATVPHRLDNGCYAKIICNLQENERVVGVHVVGPNAGEMVQGFALGLKTGATKAHFDDLVGIHPTNAEIFTTMDKTKRSGADVNVTGC